MTEQKELEEMRGKIAQKGQLMFGYVDWDTELEHTRERWRELARYAERVFGSQILNSMRENMEENDG